MLFGKKVLVTGGGGFLGSYLCAQLQGAELYVPRRVDYDLRCEQCVDQLIDHLPNKLDYVFHLAATVGGIHYNSSNPATLFYDNTMMGTMLIDRIAKRYPAAHFVCVGSVCAYPKYTPVPFNERNLWDGEPEESNGPYGVAKRILHTALKAYRQQYGLKSSYVLMTNLYGPGDDFHPDTSHVIPALIRKVQTALASGSDEVELWGTGNASRDFLFVGDAVNGLITVAQKNDCTDPINLGSGQEITIAALASLIGNLMEYDGVFIYNTDKPDGQPRRVLRINRAKELEWEPAVSLKDGLDRTIRWWRKQ